MKIVTVIGTRPEGIKMAPVLHRLQKDERLESILVNTAQHREMLDQILELFELRVDYDLNIMKSEQTLESISSEILNKLSVILELEKPDLVLVHGDTTTAYMSAYAAFLKQIPIAHVEAGLRTSNLFAPFPEEGNRRLIAQLATYHFAATELNRNNLLRENIAASTIQVVGNTVIDALYQVLMNRKQIPDDIEQLLKSKKKLIVVTAHRRENIRHLQGIFEAIKKILRKHPDVEVIFPVHKNPQIRRKVNKAFQLEGRMHIVDHLSYNVFVHVLKQAYLILTDSGGIQEEAAALIKPVLVMREETERKEGVSSGILKVIGVSPAVIFEEVQQLLGDEQRYKKMTMSVNPFGDGKASERIHDFITSSDIAKSVKRKKIKSM
ncbi:non-hydrolyzing UDP-N-acetylglucosamine 2-epimerase [Fictibacillus phosphorivorans]|uniref:non-hydrolyzing UDP-N-acetylglucosamine 2-epimerase n=1 Tax=Fictibacillus phosphorivorans TaxID=1221500 RepID=UPI0011AA648F|nr:UDP-N-acetylglucosamine 2-epimerase (non-hydrolyzing) [Fictibacillus phosphorivorans]